MIGARDDQVDWGPIWEEVVEAELGAAGWCAVLDDCPIVAGCGAVVGGRECVVPGAVVVEGVWVHEACGERSFD